MRSFSFVEYIRFFWSGGSLDGVTKYVHVGVNT